MTVDSQPIYGDCEPIDWTVYDQTGHDTPGCDCGHDGMGRAWHASDCAWRGSVDLVETASGGPSVPDRIINDGIVPVPREVFDRLVKVAMHVSLGRSAAFLTPYPDAAARTALGVLDDAGLITREQQ